MNGKVAFVIFKYIITLINNVSSKLRNSLVFVENIVQGRTLLSLKRVARVFYSYKGKKTLV